MAVRPRVEAPNLDPLKTSDTVKRFRTPEALPQRHSLEEHGNPLKGIHIASLDRIGRPDKPTILTLAQDGVRSGYMAISHEVDGTPTAITLSTRIPNPESDQPSLHYAFMIIRDPETREFTFKALTEPLYDETNQLAHYDPKNATRTYYRVAEYGQPLTDPAQILLQTASIYMALQETDGQTQFGLLPYVQQMLRESREGILTAGFPTPDQTPLPNSGRVTISTPDEENTKAQVSFRMQNAQGDIMDQYLVTTSLTEDVVIVQNQSKGITYFSNGENTIMYTPMGAFIVGGFESISVLRGMQNLVKQATTAANMHVEASNATATQELLEMRRNATRAHIDAFPDTTVRKAVRTVEDHLVTKKRRAKRQGNRIQNLDEIVRKIKEKLDSDFPRIQANREIGAQVVARLQHAATIVEQTKPQGEMVLEFGKRNDTGIMRDQLLYALRQLTEEKSPNLPSIGDVTTQVLDGKVVAKLDMYKQALLLSLDPHTGRAVLTKQESGTVTPTTFASMSNQYSLYAAGKLVRALELEPVNPAEEIPAWQTPEYVARAYLGKRMDQLVGQLLDKNTPLELAFQKDPNDKRNIVIVGKPKIEKDPTTATPYDYFALSIPKIGETRQIRLVVSQNGEVTEILMTRDISTNKLSLFIEHPTKEDARQGISLADSEPAAQHLMQFTHRVIKTLSSYDPYKRDDKYVFEERMLLAQLFGRDDLFPTEVENLEQIQTVLRMFANLPLRAGRHIPEAEESWTTTPSGEIPAVTVEDGGAEKGSSWVQAAITFFRRRPRELSPDEQAEQDIKDATKEHASGETTFLL